MQLELKFTKNPTPNTAIPRSNSPSPKNKKMQIESNPTSPKEKMIKIPLKEIKKSMKERQKNMKNIPRKTLNRRYKKLQKVLIFKNLNNRFFS